MVIACLEEHCQNYTFLFTVFVLLCVFIHFSLCFILDLLALIMKMLCTVCEEQYKLCTYPLHKTHQNIDCWHGHKLNQ